MSEFKQPGNPQHWNELQLNLFRVVFIFLLLLTIPLDPAYYQKVFSISIAHLHYQDLFQVTNYVPRLVHFSAWGIASYAGWGIALVIAVIGALVWKALEKKKVFNYDQLYFWLRVIIRYRLAIGLIGYGIIKLFPVLIAPATLSDLHTAYGDFLPWKIYYLSTAVASAHYQSTLGAIEIFAGLLLLSTRTTVIGAAIAASLLINIVLVNFAYQLGEHVYSLYLLLASAFLLAYDTPRLFNLLVKERPARADHFVPAVTGIYKFRSYFKALFFIFVLSYGFLTYKDYSSSRWPFPDTAGLSGAAGVYDVKEFKVNNRLLPYSQTDTVRWQDVVFEKWNVLSIKANKKVPIDLSNPEVNFQEDINRNYESKGNGGRLFYNYTVTNQTIHLYSKNVPNQVEVYQISRPDKSTIVLSGLNNHQDSVHIVLNRLPKEYLLDKGRRKAVSVF